MFPSCCNFGNWSTKVRTVFILIIKTVSRNSFQNSPFVIILQQTAVSEDEDVRLAKVRDVVQQLPPPHYRTAEYLIRHLARVATYGAKTGMHCKNLAIVWAPNLLR